MNKLQAGQGQTRIAHLLASFENASGSAGDEICFLRDMLGLLRDLRCFFWTASLLLVITRELASRTVLTPAPSVHCATTRSSNN
jgi:hypothetical protein